MSENASWTSLRYAVAAVEMVTPVIAELVLRPTQSALSYRPGQYVLLNDLDSDVPQRSYSIANAPAADGTLTLLVTRVEGGATSSWVHDELRSGADVVLEGPFGTFVTAAADRRPVLLLAAGSGLAPARALAEDLVRQQPARTVSLIFSGRTRADVMNSERFASWSREGHGFSYQQTLTREPEAPLHERVPVLLPRLTGQLSGWEVFVSGPPGFVTDSAAAARTLGAEPASVHTEPFFVDPQPWVSPPPAPASCESVAHR